MINRLVVSMNSEGGEVMNRGSPGDFEAVKLFSIILEWEHMTLFICQNP
jgi:hypothetical protein